MADENVAGKIDQAPVIRRINQDVAISQDECTISDEIVSEFHNAPRPILHRLRFVMNGDVVARTVAAKLRV